MPAEPKDSSIAPERSLCPILMVEDSEEDFEVAVSALRLARVDHPMLRCVTGIEALDYIHRSGKYAGPGKAPRPALVLLDLNLPGIDGRKLLKDFRDARHLATVPIVILTTSTNPRDVELCYRLGASGYLVKPVDLDKLEADIGNVANYWLRTVIPAPNDEEEWCRSSV